MGRREERGRGRERHTERQSSVASPVGCFLTRRQTLSAKAGGIFQRKEGLALERPQGTSPHLPSMGRGTPLPWKLHRVPTFKTMEPKK